MCYGRIIVIIKSVYFKTDFCVWYKYGIKYGITERNVIPIDIVQIANNHLHTITERLAILPPVSRSIIISPDINIERNRFYRGAFIRNKTLHIQHCIFRILRFVS